MTHDILIVDDEADIRELVSGLLSDEGYECRTAGDSTAALSGIRGRRPNLVILDIWLQGSELDGLEMLDVLRDEHPGLPVVMISGHGTIETAVAAIKKGAYDFIEKPFKAGRLMMIVERAIENARLLRENAELRLRAGDAAELVGESQAVRQIRRAIDRVAPTSSRVLVSGPGGAGKEVVARVVHDLSPRAEGPFVVLNCATLNPENLDAELFGATAGAIGPGLPARTGALERAHGGTLLLDEVADMPAEVQGKMVRVLQDQSFERVGGGPTVCVDVRIMASTNHDLLADVATGRFREDLFYRLNVVPMRVPPLSDRREDVPLLVEHFMEKASRLAGLSRRLIGDDALAALQAYSWPGNVRQLSNVVDWLLIMAPGGPADLVHADSLPPEISSTTPMVPQWERGTEIMGLPLREAREIFEREYLRAQVTRFGGNISRTASFVGMERSALHRKLKSLGVPNSERERPQKYDA